MTPAQFKLMVSLDMRLTGIETALKCVVKAVNDMPHVVVQEDGAIEFVGKADVTRPLLKQLFDTRVQDTLNEHRIELANAAKNLAKVKEDMIKLGNKEASAVRAEAAAEIQKMKDTIKEITEKSMTIFDSIKSDASEVTRSAMILGNEAKLKAGVPERKSFYRKR